MMFDFFKRFIDIFGALSLLIVFSPILLITIVAIKLTSNGPIFADIPPRVGKNWQPFFTYKFRTMIPNAYELLRKDPRFKKAFKEQQEGGNYKIKNDPRVTPVGRFLRRHSIDEMPQLVNVLKGEMSIVGPRPYYKEELEKQEKLYPGTRKSIEIALTAKPGITGYWQVTGRSEINFDKRIEMDAFYAQKRSIWFDILILLKTPWIMITGKGAV